MLLCSFSIDARHMRHDLRRMRVGNVPPVPYEGTYVTQVTDTPTPTGPHGGVDTGTENQESIDVVSVADGIVTKTCDGAADFDVNTPCGPSGNFVQVKYEVEGSPIQLHYGHLVSGSVLVNEGDEIKSGQPIGKTGQSGLVFAIGGQSTAIHTHFHILKMNCLMTIETSVTSLALISITSVLVDVVVLSTMAAVFIE